MSLRFDQKVHNDGPEFLCLGDTAIRKCEVAQVAVIDGNLSDKRVDIRFTLTAGGHVQHGFKSAEQVNKILAAWGLFYTPNADDEA
jgi:hypothetical protein